MVPNPLVGEDAMPNTTLKGLPVVVYERLRLRAQRNRRSLNQEMIAILADAVEAPGPAPSLSEALEPFRQAFRGAPITDEDLRRWKEEGRA
jgi:hypothetical protein